jgi:arylformamidase
LNPIIDISREISPAMIRWPETPAVRFEKRLSLAAGDGVEDTFLHLGAHAGTHIDAPAHFIAGGGTVDRLSLEDLVGPAHVVNLPDCALISADRLEQLMLPDAVQRVLFRTNNSVLQLETDKFSADFVALDDSAARWIVSKGIRLVGVDGLSVEPCGMNCATHEILLGAGVVVLEGLWLADIEPGDYELICLPLKVVGVEAAPARAVLRRPA